MLRPVLLLAAAPAAAQGFNCSKARHDAEFAVCDSTYLSSLDEELNTVYYSLARHVRDLAEVRAERADFLARRNACGAMRAASPAITAPSSTSSDATFEVAASGAP